MRETTAATLVGADLYFSVLGPLEARHGSDAVELGAPKQKALLAMLLAHPNQAVSVGQIISVVWGEDAPDTYRRSIHTYVSNLRALLSADIARVGDGYRIDIRPDQMDALVFEQALEDSQILIATDPGKAGAKLREALAMWRGRPYADLSEVEGLHAEVTRLDELRLAAVELRVDADLASGRHQQVIPEVGALAEEHPLRERFRAQHMIALYRSGRQAAALRAFERTRTYLAEEIGLEPSQNLQDLELAILRHDDELHQGTGWVTTQRLVFLAAEAENLDDAWDRNPQATADALTTRDRILNDAVTAAGGRLFRQSGERTLAAFPDVGSAVRAAETSQRDLVAADWGDLDDLGVSMAIDIGEAESRGGDFHGPPVTRAARLAAASSGGQVLVSGAVQAEVATSPVVGLQVRQLGDHQLIGFTTPEQVGQLLFDGLPSNFPPLQLATETEPRVGGVAFSLPGYEIREEIGEGTLGVVYRAYQPSVGREVAVKVIRPHLANHPRFIHRFEAEARTIARLAHPRIVPLIDFWRDADGAYLILQLLSGGSLDEAIRYRPIDRDTACQILHHIGEALDHAHSHGVVHGDLKPSNVLVDNTGNAYVSDFGIATRLLDLEISTSISADPEFLAPERKESTPTASSDIYSLGTIARHLLADSDVAALLERATAPNPDDRHRSAASFLADLDRALGSQPVEKLPLAISRNPYKGLRAFDESDSTDFHGRDALVAEIAEAVRNHRWTTVVGPSGSGKSSAVRAGLLPALTEGVIPEAVDWLHVVVSPGSKPFESLLEGLESVASEPRDLNEVFRRDGLIGVARLLLHSHGELVVVIDQLEELYTLVSDETARTEFLDSLTTAVSEDNARVRVVTTLRADFYDRPLETSELGHLVKEGLVTVTAPSAEELKEMIKVPAHAVGLSWESGLPERIAHEVGDQRGGLPLLQYALTELVEQRTGDTLTVQDYERTGGVARALATRAEAVFASLVPRQQEVARELFLRLISVDEETTDTRRRVRRSELASMGLNRADVDAVLDSYIAERLLLGDRDPLTRGATVEVAHEALLREWPRLRAWVDDQKEALILGRRFRVALREWIQSERHRDYLLTGTRLAPFRDWGENAVLTSEEKEFLSASLREDARLQGARTRRRQALVGILAAAVLVALSLAGWAFTERDRATEQALRADRNAELARARELAASAISVLDEDPRLSKLLALAAMEISAPPLEAISALHEAFLADRVVDTYRWTHDESVGALWSDLHPSGDRVVASGSTPGIGSGGLSPHLEVVDLIGDEAIWTYDLAPGASFGSSFFTPNGETVIAGAFADLTSGEVPRDELGVYAFDERNGQLIQRTDLGPCGGIVTDVSDSNVLAVTVAGSPVGCFAADDAEFQMELVDLLSGERLQITSSRLGAFPVNGRGLTGALSGDGSTVAFTSGDEEAEEAVVVADAATGQSLMEFESVSGVRFVYELSYDGSLLLHGSPFVQVGDTTTGDTLIEVRREIPDKVDASFGPDETTFYLSGSESSLQAWDIASQQQLMNIPGVGDRLSVSDNGLVLSVDGSERLAHLIRPSLRGEVATVNVDSCFVASDGIEVSGELAAVYQSCPAGPTTSVASHGSGELVYSLPGAGGQDFATSPEGRRFVRQEAGSDTPGSVGALAIRDLDTGEMIVGLEGFCTFSQLSPDRPEEQGDCRQFPEQPFAFLGWLVAWAPDGQSIAAANAIQARGALASWDAATGDIVHSRDLGSGVTVWDMVYTPDGQRLIATMVKEGAPTTVEVIDADTWEVVSETEVDSTVSGSGRLGLVGFAADGRLLAIGALKGPGTPALHWIDPETMQVETSRDRIHEGVPRVGDMSPDGRLVVTGATDGLVRVWSTEDGELIHQIPFRGASVQAVTFIDNDHLLIGTGSGEVLVMTIDNEELLEIVGDSLTRGLTPVECERFNFGDDCPTLAEMRGH